MTRSNLYPPSNRPVAMGVNGMVASAHPLASLAGMQILAEGGNAFDATVATASTLNVVEPYMSGVGGIGVALVYVAKEKRVRALNFSGRAPKAAEPDRFTEQSKQEGILPVLVPGNLYGWLTLHETYGKLERELLFQRAISYAENGFPVTHFFTNTVRLSEHLLRSFPAAEAIILGDAGPPRPGTKMYMPALAKSLRGIVKGGIESFYQGELAGEIVSGNRALGGLLTEEDLAEYRPQWQDPISINYRGYDVYTTPPNCSSFQVLQTLKTLEDSDLSYQTPDSIHNIMEVIKLCITDRIKYAGDPDYIGAPLTKLLSREYAIHQRGRISHEMAAVVSGEHFALENPDNSLRPGDPEAFDGGMTTHFAVADREGNVVTVTQTLGGGFGSGAVAGDTGIFLNNMGSFFDLEEGSPNIIGPGKMVDFVVAPTQTFRGGDFYLSMGTPGSWGILQTTPQMLINVLDFGMNVQQAIEAPRFRYFTGRNVHMEERFPLNLRQSLEARGHEVNVIEPWSTSVGGAQAILVDVGTGVFQGGADPRRDGYAAGF